MGTGLSSVVVRRERRRGSAFVLLTASGYLSAASCAGRSQSLEQHGNNGGSSVGGSSVGGATGGIATGATGGSMGGIGGDIIYEGGGRNTTGGVGVAGGAPGGNGATGGFSGDAGEGPVGGFPCIGGSQASPDLVTCNGGFAHRPSAATCPPPPPDVEIGAAGQGAAGEGGAPNDCGGKYCAPGEACIESDADVGSVTYCALVCETDSDCPSDSICACVPNLFRNSVTDESITVGLCTRATCTVDADCGSGSLCVAPYSPSDCGLPWPHEFHCQTPEDQCAGPLDCSGGSDSCRYDGAHFACEFGEVC